MPPLHPTVSFLYRQADWRPKAELFCGSKMRRPAKRRQPSRKKPKKLPTCSFVHINCSCSTQSSQTRFYFCHTALRYLFTAQTVRALAVVSQTLIVHSVKGRNILDRFLSVLFINFLCEAP